MDNNQDVISRFYPAATKRHLHKQPPSSSFTSTATARKERFQKLSLVGSRSNSTLKKKNLEMGSDEEDEQLISMVAAKRFPLPRKFLDDCNSVDHASVPRKLRSEVLGSRGRLNDWEAGGFGDFRCITAMKKLNAGSLSPPPLPPNAKKTKHPLRDRESPKKDAVKKIKKQKRLECSTRRANFCGSMITTDEEEVVETLYALAGMFPNNATTIADSRSRPPAEGSRQDAPSTVHGAMEPEGTKTEELKLSVPSSTPGNEEASKPMMKGLDEPKAAPEQQDLVGSKQFLKSEPSSEDLPMGLNAGSGPTETGLDILLPQRKSEDGEAWVSTTNPEQQHKVEGRKQKGPVLWPGLLTASHNNSISSRCNVPSWLLRSSSNPATSAMSDLASDQENGGNDGSRKKKCAVHVYISRLIRTLQNPDSEQRLSLEQGPRDVLQNVGKETVHGSSSSSIGLDAERNSNEAVKQRRRQSNGQSSGSTLARISPLEEKQSFDFLSLSTGGGSGSGAMMSQSQVPYFQSYAQQQHIPATTTFSAAPKIYYSHPYPDQLSVVPAQQLQLPPPYLGSSSGRSSHHKGGPTSVSREQQHQQAIWTMPIASSHYKQQQQPTGSRQVAGQYPSWQNGRVESSSTVMPFATSFPPPSTMEVYNGMKHDVMAQFNNNHNHQHQQMQLRQQQHQYVSARSTAVGPLSLGKRQDHHHLVLPSVGREETAMRFHSGGGSLSLQLLCNERL